MPKPRKQRVRPLKIPAPPREQPPQPIPPPPPVSDEVKIAGQVPVSEFSAVIDKATGVAARTLAKAIAEIAQRQAEALRLYEPLPAQFAFHQSQAAERIIIGSNRGGKTLPSAVEVARAVTGNDPYGKYPLRDGRCYCIGRDGRHLGAVMWRKLGRAGAFHIIRDTETGLWRAFRPWLPSDNARRSEAKPSPPLIPPRFIKKISWDKKAEGCPSMVTLTTGWEISFISSNADPSKGTDIDLAWFDEELEHEDWYAETSARLVDRCGRFVWSATPQTGTEALYNLHERAHLQRDCQRPSIAEFFVKLDENPHVLEEQKRLLAEKCVSEEDYRVRIGGEWAIHSYKIYPEYTRIIHQVKAFDIPRNWTRYVAVDPGRQVCACLFLSVPKPGTRDFPGKYYLYDELYIRDCNADMFGRAMRDKCFDQDIQSFIIDGNMGRHTEVASGKTVEDQYSEALKRYNVRSYETGTGFVYGSDAVEAGILACRELLRRNEDGVPAVLVFDSLTAFDKEIRMYHNRRVAGKITDKPDAKSANHLMDAFRYLALYEPRYIERPVKHRPSYAVRMLREKQERQAVKDGRTSFRLGPGRQ